MEDKLTKIIDYVADSLRYGGTVLTFGVGGNATTSMHLAGELSGKFEEFEDPLPCICLSENPAVLTAITNDFGWEHVFERQIRGFANEGDVLIIFSVSTSGIYLLPAIKEAALSECGVVLICGKDTHGIAPGLVDYLLELDSLDTPWVQEEQLRIVHKLCGGVKSKLVEGRKPVGVSLGG